MPLSFLAPAFLIGLAAVGVPLLIHLVQRERKRVLPFPSLMFLERLPYRSVRRRRVRHPLLLLLRSLALVLLAAAFARPLLTRSSALPRLAGGAREVVLLLDRSYSMGYAGRWSAARAAASRVLAGLAPGDHVSLVVFDAGAAVVVPPGTDAAPVRAVLDTLKPGWGRTRYAPALKLAADILGASRLERREAVLISDFQKNGRDAADAIRLPPGARLTPLRVGTEPAPDLAVTGVSFRREAVPGGERVSATARVASTGAGAPTALPVTLELDGHAVQTVRATVPASGAASVAFAPFMLAHSQTLGTVRIAPDALPADDQYHFVLSAGQSLRVLVLDAGGAAPSLYLHRALAFAEPPGFEVTRQDAALVRGADLERAAVVVLDDAPFPGGEAGRRLREWVAKGGGLVVALGEHARADGIPGIGPSVVGPSADAGGPGGVALGRLEYGHPVLEPFAAPGGGSFADARFYRRRLLTPGDSTAVPARFEDGAAALLERRYGRGRVLLWGAG
ncbi:MAG TPA: BatA domain-containing protein, partial [Longimicrobiales bacterium]